MTDSTVGANPLAPQGRIVETYRMDGTATGVTSTASTGPSSSPVAGDRVTIAAGYKALSWQYLRATEQDTGDGSLAKLTVNGFEHMPGSGPQYQEGGYSYGVDGDEVIDTVVDFLVEGQVFVSLIVVR